MLGYSDSKYCFRQTPELDKITQAYKLLLHLNKLFKSDSFDHLDPLLVSDVILT